MLSPEIVARLVVLRAKKKASRAFDWAKQLPDLPDLPTEDRKVAIIIPRRKKKE